MLQVPYALVKLTRRVQGLYVFKMGLRWWQSCRSGRVSSILTGRGSGMQGFAVAVKMGVSKKMMDTVVGVHPSSAGNFHFSYTPCTSHDSGHCLKP